MEAKTAVDSVQDLRTSCQKHGRNCPLCRKSYSPDKEVVDSHVKELLQIALAGSDSKGSDCLLDQDSYFADMEVNVLAFAWFNQRAAVEQTDELTREGRGIVADHPSLPWCCHMETQIEVSHDKSYWV